VIVAAVIVSLFIAAEMHADVVYTYGGQFDLRIPADPQRSNGWMTDAIIDVPSHLIIRDLDVSLSLTHTSDFDLQLFLRSPSGTRVVLNMYDAATEYFEGGDYQGTTFDDEAALPIEMGSPPFSGRFRPMEGTLLSAFDGEDAFGPWRFQVYDFFEGDTGHFSSYTLALTVPEPATAAFLLLTLGLALARPRQKQPVSPPR